MLNLHQYWNLRPVNLKTWKKRIPGNSGNVSFNSVPCLLRYAELNRKSGTGLSLFHSLQPEVLASQDGILVVFFAENVFGRSSGF